jgi:hypothetical protein
MPKALPKRLMKEEHSSSLKQMFSKNLNLIQGVLGENFSAGKVCPPEKA